MNIINTFIDDYCEELEIERSTIESNSRKRLVVEKRMLLSYFLRVKINLNYNEIGSLLKRDHSSVIYHVKTIEGFLKVYPHLRRMYQKIHPIYERYIDLYESKHKDFYSQLLDENTKLCARLGEREKQIRGMSKIIAQLEKEEV